MNDNLCAQGHAGDRVTLSMDTLTIERKGAAGDRRIPIDRITGVQMQPASLLSTGFVKFLEAGRPAITKDDVINGDENAVLFARKHQAEFDTLHARIEDLIRQKGAISRSESPRQATVDDTESDAEAGTSPRVADLEATSDSGGNELLANGSNGVLSIEGEDLVIRRSGIGALRREKERHIPLRSISDVRVVGPSLLQQGYLQVLVNGLDSPPLKPADAVSDDNSVLFDNKHTENIRLLERRLQEIATENRAKASFPEPVQTQTATPLEPLEPVLRFKSHIEGKNADVAVWPDRIEWGRNISGGVGRTAGRWSAAAMTGGLSLLATGIKGRNRVANMIPIKMIQGITTERHGVGFTTVTVVTASDAVAFRVVKANAERIKGTITNLMSQGPASAPVSTPAATAPPMAASAPPQPAAISGSVADELKKFAELRDAGVLSTEEFDAKKKQILGL